MDEAYTITPDTAVPLRGRRRGLVSRLLRAWWFKWILVPVAVIWACVAIGEYLWRMGFVPADLRPMWVEYAKAKSWGFGPGENGYAVIIYPMPEATARQIKEEGLAFFSRPENVALRRRGDGGIFSEWKATPLLLDRPMIHGNPTLYLSIDEIDYEEPRPFPGWVYGLFNDMVRERGNYYARGGAGYTFTIISPARRKIIYFHFG